MSLPPLPKETGNAVLDIHALYLYLQRSRDDFSDSVVTSVVDASYTDEQAQDSIGSILIDTPTVEVTYNDVLPSISFTVQPNTVVEKVEVAEDSTLINSRKQLNFINQGSDQFNISDNPTQDRLDIRFNLGNSRLISKPSVLLDRFSLIVQNYLTLEDTLTVQGDAVVRVL